MVTGTWKISLEFRTLSFGKDHEKSLIGSMHGIFIPTFIIIYIVCVYAASVYPMHGSPKM